MSQASTLAEDLLQFSVFGRNYTYVEDLAESTTTLSDFQQKLRLTTPDILEDSNRFLINWSFTYFNETDEGGDIEVQIEQDDTTLLWNKVWDHTWEDESSDAGNRWPGSGFAEITLISGVHTFDMDFRNPGSGTARIQQARMSFWRVT